MTKLSKVVDFLSPANFEIEVTGFLDESFSDYFDGLLIDHKTVDKRTTTSFLKGKIPDQAALIGILNLLYDMQFPIIRVEILDKEKHAI